MKFLKNSWHTKIYRLTFADGGLPNNLCPYFWKLLTAIIVFILFGWFYIPAYIVNKIASRVTGDEDKLDFSDGFFSLFFGIAFLINFALYILLSSVLFWIYPHVEAWQLGGIFMIIVILVIGIMIFTEWRKRIREKNPRETVIKEKKPNILAEFIKAKYHHYCPKIEWKEK